MVNARRNEYIIRINTIQSKCISTLNEFVNSCCVLLVGSYFRDDYTPYSDIDLVLITNRKNFYLYYKFVGEINSSFPSNMISVKYIEFENIEIYMNHLSNWFCFKNNLFICGNYRIFEDFNIKVKKEYDCTSLAKFVFLYINDYNRSFKFLHSNYKNGKFGCVDNEFFKLVNDYLRSKYNICNKKIEKLVKSSEYFYKLKIHHKSITDKHYSQFQKLYYYFKFSFIVNIILQNILYYQSRKLLIKLL
jgi:predicted nucleotidyltransferase